MKNLLLFMFICFPIFLIAEDIVVPKEVTDTVEQTVGAFVTKTWILSSGVMAAIQVIKKILLSFQVSVSGIKSQALAIFLSVLYVLFNLNIWEDGKISPDDWILMFEGIVSAIGGIYGYKLLWRKKEEIPLSDKEKPTCGNL